MMRGGQFTHRQKCFQLSVADALSCYSCDGRLEIGVFLKVG